VSFFEDLFRFMADWVETWPRWLQILVVVVVTPVMVLHFLTWITWRLGMLDEDRPDNVVPFKKDGGI
jgi:hypothetical protein